jgi:hypothetical protein
MRLANVVSGLALGLAPAIVLAAGCAKGHEGTVDAPSSSGSDAPASADASCGSTCDSDGDGVPDPVDKCPNTPAGQPVNKQGCADSQLTAMLNPNFPPYGLTFSPAGDPERAGGLTWQYSGINRGDLFHIWWLVCDDPTTPCGLSLDGPIDASEAWTLDVTNTDLPHGKMVFTNTTHIVLADGSNPQLNGRQTVTITDPTQQAMPFANVITLMVTPRKAQFGAEITGTGFQVTVLTEIQNPSTGAWTPALDYYDNAHAPDDAGMAAQFSFDGAFYDK